MFQEFKLLFSIVLQNLNVFNAAQEPVEYNYVRSSSTSYVDSYG